VLVQPHFAIEDPAEIRRIVDENGWATLVSGGEEGLRATHLPCLLGPEGSGGELVVLGHTARADPQSADLMQGRDVLLVFEGPNGYVSPRWYDGAPAVPTWNYVAVHVHGRPELLPPDEGFELLLRTIDHFEMAFEDPWRPDEGSMDYARRIAPGTVPFRVRAQRVEAKAKLSQNKPVDVRRGVAEGLNAAGPGGQPGLAAEMRRSLECG